MFPSKEAPMCDMVRHGGATDGHARLATRGWPRASGHARLATARMRRGIYTLDTCRSG